MDFDAMMRQSMFNMENNLYGSLIAKAIEAMGDDAFDLDGYMQLQSFIAAFNRRGVSTRILFEVIMEVFGGAGGTDE